MRAVVQRVSRAEVRVEGEVIGPAGPASMVLLGVHAEDVEADADWLARKVAEMRIFSDEDGKMNRALTDFGGEALVVSQFTLHAKTKKGARPSFIHTARETHPALRTVRPPVGRPPQAPGRHRPVRRHDGGGPHQRRPRHHHHGHPQQGMTPDSPTLADVQAQVDEWITTIGVRYFSELTNMAILTEEVGELARIMARRYGDQAKNHPMPERDLGDEMAGALGAGRLGQPDGVDLSEAFRRNLDKKTQRDADRHRNNPKLQ